MAKPTPCPNASEHTDCPTTYLGWHEWAEEKSKTHRPVRCSGCGLFKVWVPRAAALEGTEEPA